MEVDGLFREIEALFPEDTDYEDLRIRKRLAQIALVERGVDCGVPLGEKRLLLLDSLRTRLCDAHVHCFGEGLRRLPVKGAFVDMVLDALLRRYLLELRRRIPEVGAEVRRCGGCGRPLCKGELGRYTCVNFDCLRYGSYA